MIPEVKLPNEFWTKPGFALAALRRSHGPMFRLVAPSGLNGVFAVGPQFNKQILVAGGLSFLHDAWRVVDPAFDVLGKGLLILDGTEHRWLRRVHTPAFTASAIADYVPKMDAIVRRRIAAWPRDGRIDLYAEVHSAAFEITAVVLLDLGPAQRIRELYGVFRELTAAKLDPQSIKNFAPNKLRERARVALHDTLCSRLDQPDGDVLGRIVTAAAADGRTVSEDDLLTHANTLLGAGHFTTAALGSYLLLLLAAHPAYLARVLEEQASIPAQDYAGLANMGVLQNALMETERLFPPVPHLARFAREPVEIGGNQIRPEQVLFCSVAGTHMDEEVFEHPDRFDPDRFAPPRSEHLRSSYGFAPFSLGPRRCLGALLAETMIKLFVSHVLRTFELKPFREAFAFPVHFPVCVPPAGMPFQVRARPLQ